MKDLIEIVKQMEKMIGKFKPDIAIISALLSHNKKILGYLMSRYQMADSLIADYKKYLDAQHFNLIKDMFVISTPFI